MFRRPRRILEGCHACRLRHCRKYPRAWRRSVRTNIASPNIRKQGIPSNSTIVRRITTLPWLVSLRHSNCVHRGHKELTSLRCIHPPTPAPPGPPWYLWPYVRAMRQQSGCACRADIPIRIHKPIPAKAGKLTQLRRHRQC